MRKSYWYLTLMAIVSLVVVAVPVFAALSELEEDHELSMEFETPHTDWAQPYALGNVRVLYFGFALGDRGLEARDIIELMQRFDIEAEAAYHLAMRMPDEWAGGDAGVERILKLLEQPWDCFLFNGVPLTKLSAEVQNKVLRAVSEGTGLVLIGLDDERVLKPKNKVLALPPFLANNPVGDAYKVMGGRAIRLPERPQIAYRLGWEVGYDYWLERVGRAVLWTADKSPRVNLSIALEAEQVDRTELPEQGVQVELDGADAPDRLRLEVRLRRSDGAVFKLHPAPESPTTFRFVQRYRAGEYHIDAIAHSNSGVEAWATVPIEITASRKVEAIELDKGWGEIGETISGRVKLTGDLMDGERLVVQLLDARQRILIQADRPVTDATASFEFPIEDWMPMLLEVQTLVMDGEEEEVLSRYTYFHVTKRNRGQFNFLVWDNPIDTLGPYAAQQLTHLGCTVHLPIPERNAPNLMTDANDIAQVPYTTRIRTYWDEKGYMKPTCWNDEPAVDEWVDSIVSRYERARQNGVFVYSLGDETVTTGSCVHPSCLAAYRRYLRQEYGDIAALNKSWGSHYASFEQVILVKGDNDEARALALKIYPRWYDRQVFKAYNFVKLCERFGKRFKQLDPQARTGFEGAGRFADGTDIDLICRTNGFWCPYPGLQDEVIRSIANRDFIRSNWMGYTKDADSLLHKYWRMVTRGADSVWWWRWDGFGRYRGLLAPNLAPWPAIKEMQRDTQIVRDGLGSLLLKCRREDDEIAILYSFPSTFANKIEAGPSYGKYGDDHKAWHDALRSLGLQFSYVTDRMLRRGEFRARRYQVLILPQTEAIGPRETEVIREFVANGGTVIADIRPGIYDGHCKPLSQGMLDDLFGIQRTGNEEATSKTVTINCELGERQVALSLADLIVDPAVRPTNGQPMGAADTVPVCIINQAGQGHAVLLNFTMTSFPRINTEQAPPEAADFMGVLLALAGVEPKVTITDIVGNPVRDTEVIRWNGRGVDLLALFGGKDETVQVHLPRAQHIYDLREHAYRGHRATFRVHKLPSRATFIALSARRLSGPTVRLSNTPIARGEQMQVEFSYPDSRAYHAARLRVYQPDGTHAEWFDQVVIVRPEGTDIALPIAYNDPTGLWRVECIDLYTDQSVQRTVTVVQ